MIMRVIGQLMVICLAMLCLRDNAGFNCRVGEVR